RAVGQVAKCALPISGDTQAVQHLLAVLRVLGDALHTLLLRGQLHLLGLRALARLAWLAPVERDLGRRDRRAGALSVATMHVAEIAVNARDAGRDLLALETGYLGDARRDGGGS